MPGMLSESELLRSATDLYQAGRLGEAERVCRGILERDAGSAAGWNLMGMIAAAAGKMEAAAQLLQSGVAVAPNSPQLRSNLAEIQRLLGRLDAASESARAAVTLDGKFGDAWNTLGSVLKDQGKIDEAIAAYRKSLEIQPGAVMVLNNLGIALRVKGELEESIGVLRKAVESEPAYAASHNNLGNAFRDRGDVDKAVAAYQQAIKLSPNNGSFHSNLGGLFLSRDRFAEAVEEFEHAARLEPGRAVNFHNLGLALTKVWENERAVRAFDRAIELDPRSAGPHVGKAGALLRVGRVVDAESCIRRALEIDANDAGAYNELGILLQNQGKSSEALAAFRKSIALKGDSAAVHWNYSMALLAMGEMQEGWEEFEWRLRVPALRLDRGFSQPQWDGSDATGKTVLLHAEGGHGDALQFIRFLPQAVGRGGRFILECQPALVRLVGGITGVERIIARGEALPEFDAHVSLLSLPRMLKITLANIPAEVPYVAAPAAGIEAWARRLSGVDRFRVGLVWCGSDCGPGDNRTRSAEVFAPLKDVEGVKFFSLQKGPAAAQKSAAEMDWADYTPDIADFADAAALIQNLDLVISVDTSIAHLTGAMGKPIWVLIPFAADFRWLLLRTDSPWYPTMRLFRQKRIGDWEHVAAELVAALKNEVLRRDN